MNNNETVGVLKTLSDNFDSIYIKEALDAAIKSLQAELAQTVPCPQHDALDAGCPLHAGVWLCGIKPCIITWHQSTVMAGGKNE